MPLRTYVNALTSEDSTVLSVPLPRAEAAIHTIHAAGTGDLTLSRRRGSGAVESLLAGVSVSGEWTFPKTLNLEPGDTLLAKGDGLDLVVSAYFTHSPAPMPDLYGPGPQTLIAGNMTDGFFGEVSSGELFSGDDLALILGVTEGVAQNSDAGWLKFAEDNEILFVAKRNFRHSISWDHLYSRGLVYGTDDDGQAPRGTPTNQYTTVERSGNRFAVRLLTGANADPFDDTDPLFFTEDMHQLDIGAGSEWNRLIYRVHQDVPGDPATDGVRADRHGGPQVGENWANYSNSELNIAHGNGYQSWCQEQSTAYSAHRAFRGLSDVASFSRFVGSRTGSIRGWRPALKLIPNN
ncbi:hypothetical protein HLV39_12470 [Marinobacter adhaerens]|uniref:Uncharacterized protein n=1 Tax=Marinobacter adhaerens TaxID=1033846 RepID=A0A851HXC7_9GAMM|nr:hypothetical protein [Marinobacter adhaerens]NWN92306.1 hypothetical protein [Marinobacter adhaerens]